MRSAILALAATSVQGAHWAVLVAASNTYRNYRHQADVCHAYHVLKANGMKDENIIVMAYDDIANNDMNPFKGQIFNKPNATGPATNVYKGCKIDYRGEDVTPANFLKVLTGVGSGKVLKSTAEDNVFVYLADHGLPGLICFPGECRNADEMIHKTELQSAFDTMHSKKMYKKLVMYLETCESGSMFQGLKTPNVYAVSAASPDESSDAIYCGRDAVVDGQHVMACLGDEFSVSWMEDSDSPFFPGERLQNQFDWTNHRVRASTVMQWGDTAFTTDHVSDFQGITDLANKAAAGSSARSAYEAPWKPEYQRWGNHEIDLRQATSDYHMATTPEERRAATEQIQAVLKNQLAVEDAYERFLEVVYPGDAKSQEVARTASLPADQPDCELSTRAVFGKYGEFDGSTGFALKFHKYVVNVCADIADSGRNFDIADAAQQACIGTTVV